MKLTIKVSHLVAALAAVSGAVKSRASVPIYTHYLFDASDRLTIRGCDSQMQLTAHAEADVSEPGAVCLPDKIESIAKALPKDASVTIDLTNGRALVRCGKSRFTMNTLPAHEFPTMECGGEFVEIAALPDMLECVAPAMASNDVRYYLNGALLKSDGSKFAAVATDGHRMHVADSECGDVFDAILPSRSVAEIMKAGCRRIRFGDRMVEAHGGGVEIVSRVIDGQFPDYEAAIPPHADSVIVVGADSFRAAVSRARLLLGEHDAVKLTPANGALGITAASDGEDASEEIDAQCSEGQSIGFNAEYLIDAAGAVRGASIEIHTRTPNDSILVRGVGVGGLQAVVMPMRV